MSGTTKFTLVTRVEKSRMGSSAVWNVEVELNGFVGHGESLHLGYAFDEAYQDAMAKLAEGTSTKEDA